MAFDTDISTARLKMLGWCLHAAGLVVLGAAGFAVYSLAYLPLAKEEQNCVARMSVIDKLLVESAKVRAAHATFKDSLEKIQDRTEALRQRIPDRPCETEFLEQMNQAADEEGLEIRDYRRGTVTVEDAHSFLEVRVLGTGTYREICGFLDRLARLPRISTVEKVTINSDATTEAYPVDLTLRLYFGARKKPAEEGKAVHG
jgi:Tfp pilus assembly protein PilO